MAVPISNVTRRVVFSPSGVGPYAFTFEILAATDIEVYKGDTKLTLTTDYSVTINANGTGSVTLVATAGTDNITVIGARAIQRTTDFTTGGDLFANTLNDELDSLTIFSQQNAEGLARTLQAPETDPTTINMTLPRAADRADKFLAFDSDGNPVPGAIPPEVQDVLAIEDEIVAVAAIDTEVTALSAVTGNIETLAPIAANITTVAGISSEVATVAGLSSAIATVNANEGNIDIVAGLDTEISALGPIAASIQAVAADEVDIGIVAADLTGNNDIGSAAAVAADIAVVAGIATEIAAVEANATNINTVATDLAGSNTIGTVAGIAANVTTVAGISSDIATVAADGTDIGTVAGISSNVTTVAGISANVTTVAGISADVTAVASDATDIGTVATAIANVNTVATNIASVTAVAGNIDEVITAANDLNEAVSEIEVVAGNIDIINTVGTNITNINTVAGISADVTTVATNVADVTNFADVYLGPAATDPATRNDSSALQAGDLYFNTADDALKVYTGAAWTVAYVPADGFLVAANNLSDVSNAATARQNLELEIGVDVQAYDATILVDADIGVNVQAYDATLLNDADIGVSVQAYDADTAKLDVAQAFTAQQTFAELKETTYTLGTSGSIALDPANGSIQSSTLSGNPTFTDSLEAGQTVVLMLNGGASYTVTWPTITWVTSTGNAAPTLTANDTLVFWKVSTTLYGAYVGSYT